MQNWDAVPDPLRGMCNEDFDWRKSSLTSWWLVITCSWFLTEAAGSALHNSVRETLPVSRCRCPSLSHTPWSPSRGSSWATSGPLIRPLQIVSGPNHSLGDIIATIPHIAFSHLDNKNTRDVAVNCTVDKMSVKNNNADKGVVVKVVSTYHLSLVNPSTKNEDIWHNSSRNWSHS